MADVIGGPALIPGQQWWGPPYEPAVGLPPWWEGTRIALPWGGEQGAPDWQQLIGNAPGGAPEAQAWMNVLLPWYQQAQQQQQFVDQMRWLQQQAGQEEAYKRWLATGGWEQEAQRQQEQLGYQRWLATGGWEQEAQRQQEQLGYQRWLATGTWGHETEQQQRQLEAQREIERMRAATAREQSAMAAFGRRWLPNTRWL